MWVIRPLAYYRPETKTWDLENAVVSHAAGNITQGRVSSHVNESTGAKHRSDYSANARNPERRNCAIPAFHAFPPTLAPFRTHFHTAGVAVEPGCCVLPRRSESVFTASHLCVAAAVILVFSNNFCHLFLALGEGDRVPDGLPHGRNILFAGTLYLLFRAQPRTAQLISRRTSRC